MVYDILGIESYTKKVWISAGDLVQNSENTLWPFFRSS